MYYTVGIVVELFIAIFRAASATWIIYGYVQLRFFNINDDKSKFSGKKDIDNLPAKSFEIK
jgi:hypothetical protein